MKSLLKISLLFAFLFSYLLAEEYEFDQVELGLYPKIQLHFTGKNLRNLPKEPISILEKTETETKEVEFIRIIQTNEPKPVSFLISVGLSNWKQNQTSKEILNFLLKELPKNSKITLHFYHTKSILFKENLSKQEAQNKFQEIEQANENHFIPNLEYVYKNLSKSNPSLHIVVAPSLTKEGDITRVVSQRETKIPIFIIAPEFIIYKAASFLSNGKFININHLNLNSEIHDELKKFFKPFTIIEYESPLYDILENFPSREIQVEVTIGNKNFLKTYTVTPLQIIQGWFSNVEIILLVLLLILCFLILLAYAHYQRKKRLQWEEYLRKQEEIRKSDLYYHENVNYETKQTVKLVASREIPEEEWQKFEEEELELDLSNEEEDSEILNLPPGESYEKAFFIQKEGPNPGRQFFINKDETIIGRDPKVDLVLLDSTVSLRHAKVRKINKTYYIFDLVSERGVLINGKKLLKPRPLFDFDEVRLGKVLLLFRGN